MRTILPIALALTVGAACSQRVTTEEEFARQERELVRVGTRGTPAFYVNGRHLSGALPLSEFSRVIDEEIAKADAAYKQGIKPDRYYDTIVATGQKVFEESIPRNVRLSEAPSHGKPVLLYDLRCAGTKSYLAIADEFLDRTTTKGQPHA